LQFDETSMIN